MTRSHPFSLASIARVVAHTLAVESLLLAYFGPDVVMPLGSALAATIGILLMFWHRAVRVVRGTIQRFTGARTGSDVIRSTDPES